LFLLVYAMFTISSIVRELNVNWEDVYRWLREMGYHSFRGICKWSKYLNLGCEDLYNILLGYIMLRKHGVKFYTFPPLYKDVVVPWTWIIVNVFNYEMIDYIVDRYRDRGLRIQSVIFDAGVDKMWFKEYGYLPIDYDDSYWNKYWSGIDYLKSLSKQYGFFLEAVVPDYPDDYSYKWGKKHALWSEECSDYPTNIDRTIDNILRVVESDNSVVWLIPSQGYEENPHSMYYSIKILMDLGLHKRYRIAIANLCKSLKASTILETMNMARKACSKCSYHIFGPSLSGIRKIFENNLFRRGDTWDSIAWTYPRKSRIGHPQNSYEEIKYFAWYMKHLYYSIKHGTSKRS